jgi:ferredoxin
VTGALQLSKVSKVTAAVTAGGNPLIANAFGLPSVDTCPGATSVCLADCYAEALTRIRPATAAMLARNLATLRAAGTVPAMTGLLGDAVDAYRRELTLAQARGVTVARVFRIHWSGDFYSTDYARAWARVIADRPDVEFWAYTRSFTDPVDVTGVLAGLGNLRLYLSVDRDNVAAAQLVRTVHPGLRWAWLGETFADGKAGLADRVGAVYPCPENGRRLPMITDRGSACVRCGICPDGRGDVLFSITRR